MTKGNRQFSGEALRRLRRHVPIGRTREIRKQIKSSAEGPTLTQAELGKAAGRTRNVVGRAERDSKCSLESAKRFATVVGVPVEELYKEPLADNSVRLTAQEREVIEAMRLHPQLGRDLRLCAMALRLAHEPETPSPHAGAP